MQYLLAHGGIEAVFRSHQGHVLHNRRIADGWAVSHSDVFKLKWRSGAGASAHDSRDGLPPRVVYMGISR